MAAWVIGQIVPCFYPGSFSIRVSSHYFTVFCGATSMPLQGTPTMAAGITKEVWSIRRLLFMRTPDIWDAELDHVFL